MDDLEFVQKCVKGDKRAWDEFIDKYSRLIYNYIHSVLKIKGFGFTQESLNDIFQEIILSLVKDNFKKLNSFKARNGCSLASWLRRVTVNSTISYTRSLKATVSIDAEDEKGFSLAEIIPSDSVSAAQVLNQKERIKHLEDCIDRLQDDDKYFLELHIHRALSLEELRAYFKVSRGAIDMRKLRIVQRLKECFKDKGFLLDS